MNPPFRTVVALIAALLTGPVTSMAVPIAFGTSFYDVIDNGSPILWENARLAAAGLTHNGVPGHLAVITSAAEDNFIATSFSVYFNPIDGVNFGQVRIFFGPWIGLSAPANSNNPANYGWVTGEALTYQNWRSGEPSGDGRHVHYLSASDFPALVGWNDQSTGTSPRRYIVEFPNANALPEPGSLAILVLGLGALVAVRRRIG